MPDDRAILPCPTDRYSHAILLSPDAYSVSRPVAYGEWRVHEDAARILAKQLAYMFPSLRVLAELSSGWQPGLWSSADRLNASIFSQASRIVFVVPSRSVECFLAFANTYLVPLLQHERTSGGRPEWHSRFLIVLLSSMTLPNELTPGLPFISVVHFREIGFHRDVIALNQLYDEIKDFWIPKHAINSSIRNNLKRSHPAYRLNESYQTTAMLDVSTHAIGKVESASHDRSAVVGDSRRHENRLGKRYSSSNDLQADREFEALQCVQNQLDTIVINTINNNKEVDLTALKDSLLSQNKVEMQTETDKIRVEIDQDFISDLSSNTELTNYHKSEETDNMNHFTQTSQHGEKKSSNISDMIGSNIENGGEKKIESKSDEISESTRQGRMNSKARSESTSGLDVVQIQSSPECELIRSKSLLETVVEKPVSFAGQSMDYADMTEQDQDQLRREDKDKLDNIIVPKLIHKKLQYDPQISPIQITATSESRFEIRTDTTEGATCDSDRREEVEKNEPVNIDALYSPKAPRFITGQADRSPPFRHLDRALSPVRDHSPRPLNKSMTDLPSLRQQQDNAPRPIKIVKVSRSMGANRLASNNRSLPDLSGASSTGRRTLIIRPTRIRRDASLTKQILVDVLPPPSVPVVQPLRTRLVGSSDVQRQGVANRSTIRPTSPRYHVKKILKPTIPSESNTGPSCSYNRDDSAKILGGMVRPRFGCHEDESNRWQFEDNMSNTALIRSCSSSPVSPSNDQSTLILSILVMVLVLLLAVTILCTGSRNNRG